jgi:hypothetical protein
VILRGWPILILFVAATAAAQMQHPAMSAPPSDAHMHMSGSAMNECPWLTRGTAAAILDGNVSLTVAMPSHTEGSCTFRGLQNPAETLTVTVGSMAPPACGKKSAKLVGVANWASECSIFRSHHRHIESISGQARNTYFTITLSLRGKKRWREKDTQLENIAELVAGNLY